MNLNFGKNWGQTYQEIPSLLSIVPLPSKGVYGALFSGFTTPLLYGAFSELLGEREKLVHKSATTGDKDKACAEKKEKDETEEIIREWIIKFPRKDYYISEVYTEDNEENTDKVMRLIERERERETEK